MFPAGSINFLCNMICCITSEQVERPYLAISPLNTSSNTRLGQSRINIYGSRWISSPVILISVVENFSSKIMNALNFKFFLHFHFYLPSSQAFSSWINHQRWCLSSRCLSASPRASEGRRNGRKQFLTRCRCISFFSSPAAIMRRIFYSRRVLFRTAPRCEILTTLFAFFWVLRRKTLSPRNLFDFYYNELIDSY